MEGCTSNWPLEKEFAEISTRKNLGEVKDVCLDKKDPNLVCVELQNAVLHFRKETTSFTKNWNENSGINYYFTLISDKLEQVPAFFVIPVDIAKKAQIIGV